MGNQRSLYQFGDLVFYLGQLWRVAGFCQGAKVLHQCKGLAVDELLDKARHLAAIHKAPDADWAWLVGELVGLGWLR